MLGELHSDPQQVDRPAYAHYQWKHIQVGGLENPDDVHTGQ